MAQNIWYLKYCSADGYTEFTQLTPGRLLLKSKEGQLVLVRTVNIPAVSNDTITKRTDLLLSFKHPNVLPIRHCYVQDNIALLEDYSPQGCLANNFVVNRQSLANCMKALASGLHYLHTHKYVHLRLTPQNIFWKNGSLLIGGLSPTTEASENSFQSDCYNAPEYEEGEFGYHSDVWSLGVVFLELCLSRSLNEEEKRSIKEVPQRITAKVDNLQIREMIEKMLSLRPQTQEIMSLVDAEFDRLPQKDLVGDTLRCLENLRFCRTNRFKFINLLGRYRVQLQNRANQGDHRAMYLMGRIFEYNTGSEEAAREWFFKAIKHGDVLSYNSLYFLEEKHEVANEYLRKGCELNDFMCLWNTGRSFGFGFPGFEADIPKGIEILRKLPKEFGFARADIGKLTAKLHGLSSDEPHEQFQSWFQQGAQLGDMEAIEHLSVLYYQKDKYRKSIGWAIIGLRMEDRIDQGKFDMRDVCAQSFKMIGDRIAFTRWLRRRQLDGKEGFKKDICRSLVFF